MSNETNKPTEAQELTDKELEGVVGGLKVRGAGIVVLGELSPEELRVDGAEFVPVPPVPPAPTGGAFTYDWSQVRK